MKKSNIRKMVEECVHEVLSESLRPIDDTVQKAILTRFPPKFHKTIDFSTASANEDEVTKWYVENKKGGKVIRASATYYAGGNYVLYAQVRGGTSSVPNIKILAAGPKETIGALITKIQGQLPPTIHPSGPTPPPGEEERWAQYGGDPAKRPWGLGT